LQEKEVMRVGAEQTVPINARVIAVAGRDLWKAVQDGSFRKDLFFRLNVLRISIPPLRTRKEDIPELLNHFIGYYAKKYTISEPVLPNAYVNKLMNYSWPGNVRQLKHFAEQLLLNCSFRYSTDILDALFEELSRIAETDEQRPDESTLSQPLDSQVQISRHTTDAEKITAALEKARFNRTRAAAMLGIGRTTLWRKMKEFGLDTLYN
jgi:transcriptional regulator with PAS, ATPase and Fis domain